MLSRLIQFSLSQRLLIGLLPSLAAIVPGGHSSGSIAPVVQAWPSGHGRQLWSAVCPDALLNVPASHSVGATEPSAQKPPRSHTSHEVWLVRP